MDWFAALFRASGARVAEFTNYMLASMQKAFKQQGDTDREGSYSLLLVIITLVT